MQKISNYADSSFGLIIQELKEQYGEDRTLPVVPNGQTVIIYFPPFSYFSDIVPFIINPNAIFIWSEGQQNSGQLIADIEYTITGDNRIQLTALWEPTVQANALGLLNVTVTQ